MSLENDNDIIKEKVVILGDSSVGKSSILRRFKFNFFDTGHDSTVGCEFFAKEILLNSKKIKMLLWDTAGQEVFRSFTPNFLRGAKIILITYDITNEKSYKNIDSWIMDAKKIKNSRIVIFGNKSDIINENNIILDKVTENLINTKHEDADIIYFKNVSAKTGENITELFNFIGEQILLKKSIPVYSESNYNNIDVINLENSNKRKLNDGCCG
jgi:Ras-related protein Rab-6A